MGVDVLLDTHALVWFWTGDERLPVAMRALIEDLTTSVNVSAVSVYELANKHRLGKWAQVATLVDRFEAEASLDGFRVVDVTAAHARLAGRLRGSHRDPFDRLLCAQSILGNLKLVSADAVLADFGADLVWASL